MPVRSEATERAASTLEAAVTAEMIMSVSRTASRADEATRTPRLSAASFSFVPACSRKQDVPSGDTLNAGFTQTGSDRLAGFAKANKRNAWSVATGHEGDLLSRVWNASYRWRSLGVE